MLGGWSTIKTLPEGRAGKWTVGLTLACILLLFFSLSGCKSWDKAYEKAATTTFKVTVLRDSTAVGMIKMMDPSIKPSPKLGDTVEYVIESDPDILYKKLAIGEIEIAVLPTEMAAKLYNNGVEYQLAAVNTGGVMYVLTNGLAIDSLSDLKGQKVQVAGKGGASDAIFRYLLSQNGIDPNKDVTLEYLASPEELAQMAIEGSSKISLLPEPLVSKVLSKNSNIKVALDMQEIWTRINGAQTPLAQTCLVVKTEVATRDSETLKLFLEDYANSIAWVNKNPAAAAELVPKHDMGIPEEVAEAAIPRLNLLYVNAKDAKPAVEKYLKVLLDLSPDSVGSKMPDANFYHQK